MSEYTITLSEQEQTGFDYQASITNESVQNMIQRRVSEIGISFAHDCKRAKAQELIVKIQDDPDAYEAAIKPIYDAKVEAAVIAAAEVIEDVK